MSTLAQSVSTIRKPWQWIAIGGGILLVWAALALPHLNSSPPGSHPTVTEPVAQDYAAVPSASRSLGLYAGADLMKQADSGSETARDAVSGRKTVQTTSMSIVVQHPAEIADEVTRLAENLGGYLVTADSGGQSATSGSLTIRVPVARFEEARAEIRKLGVRVESEKVEAQDVTRQYVDQDASIRNLRAEEAQYLAIMKQASTVKDMLAVTERLSEVRGQIEQQQAEFNALSRQIETVSIAISLRTESEAQVALLNWRPLYQLKMALRDGWESLANYATAMITVLFYLPAVLLWTATILGVFVIGSKIVRWAGKHWLGWKAAEARAVQ